ncbi:hypothetical protein NT6N_25480 [Oceaniferula spumae]|uniref:Uncharacterized protein n=1 Tax=Oceaniferula spumae TaxID=2979115 RepID=A0AAT9FNF5_9BACT
MNIKLTTYVASVLIGLASLTQADEFTLVDGNLNGFVHIKEKKAKGEPDNLYISRAQIRKVQAVELDEKKDNAVAAVHITIGDTAGMVHIYYFPDFAKAKAFAERVVKGN